MSTTAHSTDRELFELTALDSNQTIYEADKAVQDSVTQRLSEFIMTDYSRIQKISALKA